MGACPWWGLQRSGRFGVCDTVGGGCGGIRKIGKTHRAQRFLVTRIRLQDWRNLLLRYCEGFLVRLHPVTAGARGGWGVRVDGAKQARGRIGQSDDASRIVHHVAPRGRARLCRGSSRTPHTALSNISQRNEQQHMRRSRRHLRRRGGSHWQAGNETHYERHTKKWGFGSSCQPPSGSHCARQQYQTWPPTTHTTYAAASASSF
jgi:hypothetical protein